MLVQLQVLVLLVKQNCKKMNKTILKINRYNIAIALLIAIFFSTDRYLKILSQNLDSTSNFKLIKDFFSFTFTPNYNIAFSLPFSGIILNFLIGVIIIALFFFLFFLNKEKINIFLSFSLLMILLGAISNFIDRLSYGYVIDYFYLQYFTVFNLADVGISLGALLALIAINKKPSC